MSKSAAQEAKKAVEDKLKSTEDRLDDLLRKLRRQAPAAVEPQPSHP